MARLAQRKKKRSSLPFFFILLLIVLGGGGYTYITFFEGEKPLIEANNLPTYLGKTTHFTITISDMKNRKDLFVCAVMLGITLATNLAAGFLVGIAVAYLLKIKKLSV